MSGPALVLDNVDTLLARRAWLEQQLEAARVETEGVRAENTALKQRVRDLELDNEVKDRTILRLSQENEDLRRELYGRSSEREKPQLQAAQAQSPSGSGRAGEGTPGPGSQSAPAGSSGGEATGRGGAGGATGGTTGGGSGKPPRPPRGYGRAPLPKSLPRRTEEIHPPPEQRVCPCCGGQRRVMKGAEERSERVDYVPASVVVVETVRFKYSCSRCEEGGVAIAPPPPSLIERGRPTAAMLAYVITSKYADHLPLNRVAGILRRQGLPIGRSTLTGWIHPPAFQLRPVVMTMIDALRRQALIRFDETELPVLDREHPDGIRKGRMWVYRGGPGEVVFVYTPTKEHATPRGPKELLADYHGYLQADAAGIFDVLFEDGTRIEVGCHAHARRGFVKAKKTEPVAAGLVLDLYRQIYRVEAEANERKLTPDERHALRQARSAPLVDELYTTVRRWTDEGRFLPKSEMGKAIRYLLNHEQALRRFLEDGRLPIDNNDTERALRSVALGRNNWLFAGSETGAVDAAVLYSLVVSCKEIDVDPFAYLSDVLDRLHDHPASRIAELTPRGWKAALERERAAREQATGPGP